MRYSRAVLIFVLLLFSSSLVLAGEYNEAPMLNELVQQGELPSVELRLPESSDVYVVEPVEEIGKYGGTLYTAGLTPTGDGDDQMLTSVPALVSASIPFGEEYLPHFAKSIEFSDDMTEYTVTFRRGVKWSDGEPFTTEDVLFWYDHVLLNPELTPAVDPRWRAGAEVMDLAAIDDYTIQISFAETNPYFINQLIHPADFLTPKHYLKQFHPDFTPGEEVEQLAAEEGYDAWYQLFLAKDDMQYALPLNAERPVVGPYVMTRQTSERRVFERNPFFWKVDTAGNQLPYVDRIENQIIGDVEVYNGMVISGQLDFAGFYTRLENYSLYRTYEEEGGYQTLLWVDGHGSKLNFAFNQTHPDPVLQDVFRDARFRQALSLAIDREEFNDIFFFGQAQPRQFTVLETHPYFEQDFADSYAEFDPERANALLDEMGLDQRGGDGMRLRPDGQPFDVDIEVVLTSTITIEQVELVTGQWREELGVDFSSQQISGELAAQRAPGNMMDANTWTGSGSTYVNFPSMPFQFLPFIPMWSCSAWPQWSHWFNSDGRDGEEPPEHIKELRGWWEQTQSEPDAERRRELAQKILASQAENVWKIGTVGSAPHPIVVSSRLGNVSDEGLWSWDVLWSMSHDPEQVFIRD